MAIGTSSCTFCGKPMQTKTYRIPGLRPVEVQFCDCPQAVEEAEAKEREAERQRRTLEFAARWQRAEIPEMFQHVDADFAHVDVLNSRRSLYIFGPNGRGKTYLACQIAKGWLIRNLSIKPSMRFLAAGDIASIIDQARKRWDMTEEDVFSRWLGVGLLVLDDIGKGTASEYGADLLFRVIDGRWKKRKPTILTSQYNTKALGERYAKAAPATNMALLSRLRGWCEPIELDGPDRRLDAR